MATLGADFIRAQQAGGVAAAAKHFPGLGAAARSQDTDLRPVTLRAVADLARAYRNGTVSRGSGEAAVARIASLHRTLGQ
ncbi:MAG TPA: hypothetical protein VGJ50_25850 [Streptosporangiaceae bacterium]